jgi:aryl-alcohol dehydrogenase-like predicted oxidoreductase
MPIPGLRRPDQVEDAAAALTWSLRAEEHRRLDALALGLAAGMPANPFQSA